MWPYWVMFLLPAWAAINSAGSWVTRGPIGGEAR